MTTYDFIAALWKWSDERAGSDPAWHFVTVPAAQSEQIRDELVGPPHGFGSVRVSVRVGRTSWQTSVFPDKRSGCYVLPMKRSVRLAEDLEPGDAVGVKLTVLDPT